MMDTITVAILVKTREGRPIKMEGNDLKGFAHSGEQCTFKLLF